MTRKHTSVHQYSRTPITVIPKNTRTDKYYITINSNDKQKCDSMTPNMPIIIVKCARHLI